MWMRTRFCAFRKSSIDLLYDRLDTAALVMQGHTLLGWLLTRVTWTTIMLQQACTLLIYNFLSLALCGSVL